MKAKILIVLGLLGAVFTLGLFKGHSNKKEKAKKIKRAYGVKKRNNRIRRRNDNIDTIKRRLHAKARDSSDRGKGGN